MAPQRKAKRQSNSMSAARYVSSLADFRFPNVFNPYAESCPIHDAPNAPDIRRQNLEMVLTAALEGGVEAIWMGRDLGHRGGRRTGLALTDDAHLSCHGAIFGCSTLKRATRGPAVAERTATIIWDMLAAVHQRIFLWNVFPLHPHEQDDPLSNRCHTRSERQACRELLSQLLQSLSPKRVVAIGRNAQNALAELDIPSIGVRHPSYGGQSEFISSISHLYGVAPFHHRTKQLDLSL